MKLFLKTVAIFIITFIVLILLQLILLKSILNNNTNFTLNDTTSTLILGDSHIEAGLNDSIINNSINFSFGGSPTFFNYIKLKKIAKNNKQIKTVVFGYSPINLTGGGFYEVPKMKSMLINYYYLMDYSDYFDVAKYNFQGLISGITVISRSIADINFRQKENVKNVGIGGFRKMPLNTRELLEKDIRDKSIKKGYPDIISTKYFFKIVDFCENNDIKLIILNTPVHQSLIKKSEQRREEYDKFIKNLDLEIIFWDYEHLHFEDKYFYDENHLNYEGAMIFSNLINDRLKKQIN